LKKTPPTSSSGSRFFHSALSRFRTAAVLLLLLALASPGLARSWRIADFHDSIAISKDGSCVVTERLSIVFVGHFEGIHRYIPISYRGPEGENYELFLQVVSVKDGEGNALKFEKKTQKENLVLTIYVPGAEDATRVVEITYLVRNGTRFFPDFDEFYWNVTGTQWPVPIDHASATIVLPAEAAGLRAQAFTGAYGSTAREATATVNGNQVEVETANPLPMRAGLTADVYIPKGLLQPPGTGTRIGWFLRSNPIVFVPPLSFIVMFGLWLWRGRDPDPGMSVAPMYEPPLKMTPAECGTLIDDAMLPRDISATIVDLAVKGYVKIEDKTVEGFLTKHHDYIFHLQKPDRSEWQNLQPHERAILSKLFGVSGDQIDLSDLKNSFYTVLPMLKQDVFANLKQRGLYSVDPDSAHAYTLGGIALIAVITFLATKLFGLDLFSSGLMTAICVAISVLICFLFGRIMSAKSLAGAQAWVQVKGFEDFMSRVEGDRLRRMPSDTFEKFLPYAMALGVEAKWAKAFASLGLDQPPPTWYVGPWGPGWNAILFTSALSNMSTTAAQTFVSQPRSSSGGSGWGGGGGGFSGGGFGGGGGDAF
jgi:uncharacterized membrane protein